LHCFDEKCFCDALDFLIEKIRFLFKPKGKRIYYLTNNARLNLLGEIKK